MKRIIIATLLVTTTLWITGCKSPKGNVNGMNFGKSRPNLVQ